MRAIPDESSMEEALTLQALMATHPIALFEYTGETLAAAMNDPLIRQIYATNIRANASFAAQPEGASGTYYHGTTAKNAKRILRKGFDIDLSGSRQRTLHGSTTELPGIYLAGDLHHARWYAGLAHTGKASTEPGAVIEVTVNGRIMPSEDWWRLRAEIGEELPGGMYDDENNRKQVMLARARAQERGFVGFVESASPVEVVVFDKRHVKVVGLAE